MEEHVDKGNFTKDAPEIKKFKKAKEKKVIYYDKIFTTKG